MQENIVILKGLEEIGHLFLNRTMNKIKIKSILAKDYPVSYDPIKIFDVNGNSQRMILSPIEEKLQYTADMTDEKRKWIKTVYEGSIKALYRANLEEFNLDFDSEEYLEVPHEKEIFWETYTEDEIGIIPDTSSLMDGLISRLIESNEYKDRTDISGKIDLDIYLSPTVIKELQQHAMNRQKQITERIKGKEDLLNHFAEEKRKARIALRTLGELVKFRDSKNVRLKLMEVRIQDGNVSDWNILMEAKLLHLDIPKIFITNDLIQSALADLMGLKQKYMYPIHLLKLKEINLNNKNEVGAALYDLAIQFGEIILETENGESQLILQSDWPNKMSPSWVDKKLFTRIKYDDINYKNIILEIINKKRSSYEKIEDFDPRMKTLL